MPTIHFLARHQDGEPTTHDVTARAGRSVMEAAVDANVKGIAADCGGSLTCATCHVYIPEPWASQLPPPSDDEIGMLEFTASPRQAGSRLSCQITLTEALDGLTVELPAAQY